MKVINDIELNYSRVLQPDVADELTAKQLTMIGTACAYALNSEDMFTNLQASLTDVEINAVKTAALIMQMNNVYYRSVHLLEDSEISAMPAGLRMQSMLSHGIDNIDFELMATAVSALNGCGMCLQAHSAQLVKHGVSKSAIAHLFRIAAVLNAKASAQALTMAEAG